MSSIVARLMDGNKVYGYSVRLDNGQVSQLTKEQVFVMAKEKQLMNVKATGNSPADGITGINGFELKKLPTISIKLPEFDSSVGTSAMIRHHEEFKAFLDGIPAGIDKGLMHNELSRLLSDDYYSGVINPETVHADSDKLVLKHVIYISAIYGGQGINPASLQACNGDGYALYELFKSLEKKSGSVDAKTNSILSSVVGYVIANESDSPVNTSIGVIAPGATRIVSTAECSMLMASPTICGKIRNTRIIFRGAKPSPTQIIKQGGLLNNFYLNISGDNTPGFKISIDELPQSERLRILPSDALYEYCIGRVKGIMGEDAFNSLYNNKGTAAKKHPKADTSKGIMGMFKR